MEEEWSHRPVCVHSECQSGDYAGLPLHAQMGCTAYTEGALFIETKSSNQTCMRQHTFLSRHPPPPLQKIHIFTQTGRSGDATAAPKAHMKE